MPLKKPLKTYKRTVVVESIYLGRPRLAILMELESAYREMVREAVEYAVENNTRSLAKLHKALYKWFRGSVRDTPGMPTRLVKGVITRYTGEDC